MRSPLIRKLPKPDLLLKEFYALRPVLTQEAPLVPMVDWRGAEDARSMSERISRKRDENMLAMERGLWIRCVCITLTLTMSLICRCQSL